MNSANCVGGGVSLDFGVADPRLCPVRFHDPSSGVVSLVRRLVISGSSAIVAKFFSTFFNAGRRIGLLRYPLRVGAKIKAGVPCPATRRVLTSGIEEEIMNGEHR